MHHFRTQAQLWTKNWSRCRSQMWRKLHVVSATSQVIVAGSFGVSLFIDLGCPLDLGKHSGCFMTIKWWSMSDVIYVPTCERQTSGCHFLNRNFRYPISQVAVFKHLILRVDATSHRMWKLSLLKFCWFVHLPWSIPFQEQFISGSLRSGSAERIDCRVSPSYNCVKLKACSHRTHRKIKTMSLPNYKYLNDSIHTKIWWTSQKINFISKFAFAWWKWTYWECSVVFIAFTFGSFCPTVYFTTKASQQDFQGSCISGVSHSSSVRH